MRRKKKAVWHLLKKAVTNFVGNYKDPNLDAILENMLTKLEALGCAMSL